MSDVLMTSIVLKTDVTLMDIVSTRMLGQFGFLAQVMRLRGFLCYITLSAVLFITVTLLSIRTICAYTDESEQEGVFGHSLLA